jgi:predicted transcriptional regulator of viral defense system
MAAKRTQSNARTISPSIASIVAYLEQQEKTLTSAKEIGQFLGLQPGDEHLNDVLRRLHDRGWLVRLPIRGAYEFLPARSGTSPSGDPWIELRLLLATETNLTTQVALSSAAFLRGYAERKPRKHILLMDKEQSLRPRLRDIFRVVRTKSDRLFGAEEFQGLPVSTASRLVLECVLYWRIAGDLRSSDHWIRQCLKDASPETVRRWTHKMGGSVPRRVGYLAERFGAFEIASVLEPKGTGTTAFFGPKYETGRFNAKWRIYDTIGVAKLGA